jgi:hypothetical protein
MVVRELLEQIERPLSYQPIVGVRELDQFGDAPWVVLDQGSTCFEPASPRRSPPLSNS